MKIVFSKPKKSKVLLYDAETKKFADIIFPRKNYEIMHTRKEKINIYIFIITLLKTGFKSLKDNYKKNYINTVSPKIVLCGIDNHAGFYNLKKMCNKPKYIALQNGLCSLERYENFYNYCRGYYKKNKERLGVDHNFVFSNNEKLILSKIINTKIHISGSILNNEFPLKPAKIKKKKTMMYISVLGGSASSKEKILLKVEKPILKLLLKYCRLNNMVLNFLGRPNRGSVPNRYHQKLKTLLENNLPKGNWKYLSFASQKKKYETMNKQSLVIFTYSTLGWEALAKGIRCLQVTTSQSIPGKKYFNIGKTFPIEGYYKKYKKSGEFWTNSLKSSSFNRLLNKIMNYPNSKWKKISKMHSNEILGYDPYNYKIKKLMKNILDNKE